MKTRIDFALSPEQRHDAREALKILSGTGISLSDAAKKAVMGKKSLRRVTVEEAIDEFIREKLRSGIRGSSVDWYERNLGWLVNLIGDKNIDEISRQDFRELLQEHKHTVCTTKAAARAAGALWKWGLKTEPQITTIDVTTGIAKNNTGSGGDADFLKVDEVAVLLENAGKYKNALAVMLFGGIRPEEMAGKEKPRLLWKHVRKSEKMIRVPADIAKTGKPRIIEGLPPALWRWIKPGKDEEPICPFLSAQIPRNLSRFMNRKWPHDATRHTFATYMLAWTGDQGKVATWLGHEGNPQMLNNHYRGLATKEEARAFLALRPD